MFYTMLGFAILLAVMMGGRLLLNRRPAAGRAHVAPTSGGLLILRPPARIGIMLGIAALFPAVVFELMAARATAIGQRGVVTLVVAGLLALAVAVHQFLSAFVQRFEVHVGGIERVGVAMRRRMRWSDVSKVAYNPMQHWFFLIATDGTKLWLSEELRGIGDFAELALRRVPAAALADPMARETLEELAAEARSERELELVKQS